MPTKRLKINDVAEVSDAVVVTPMIPAPPSMGVAPPPAKTDYELAVEAFHAAEFAYEEKEKYVTEGYAIHDIVANCGGDADKAAREWCTLWAQLATLLEERNSRRRAAADALRQAVTLTESQWKGPDGKPDSLTCGSFTVTSKTKRSFDAQDLFSGTQRHGLLESLLALKGVDKDGKEYKLVDQVWKIDFDGVKNWLIANNLGDVLTSAYEEKNDTPAVNGPRELTFLGETRKS